MSSNNFACKLGFEVLVVYKLQEKGAEKKFVCSKLLRSVSSLVSVGFRCVYTLLEIWPGNLGLNPFPDEVIFMDPYVSSIPTYTVIHPLTFLESLQIFSNKIGNRVSDFDQT